MEEVMEKTTHQNLNEEEEGPRVLVFNGPKEKEGKPDWSVFPFFEAEEVLKAFSFGAQKYGAPFTYRQGQGVPESDLIAATFRHLIAIQQGEDIASDSSCLHWSHIAANALMSIYTVNQRRKYAK